MSLYLLLADDDSAATASMLLYAAETVDDLVRSVTDVGGAVHALVACAGPYSFAGLVELPNDSAAVAFSAVSAAHGRRITLAPAVAIGDLPEVVAAAQRMTVTSSGDDAQAEGEKPSPEGGGPAVGGGR
jgi:uncharacterized protein with GYD domain